MGQNLRMFLKCFEVNRVFLCKLIANSAIRADYVHYKIDFQQFASDPVNPSLGVSRRAPLFYKSGGAAL